jgi:hypothetical protein
MWYSRKVCPFGSVLTRPKSHSVSSICGSKPFASWFTLPTVPADPVHRDLNEMIPTVMVALLAYGQLI